MRPRTEPGQQPGRPRRYAVRFLANLRRRPAPVRPARAAQLRALTALLDEAVAAQTPADLVVAACGEPGPLSGQTAQEAGRQCMVLHRLHARMRDLPLTESDLVEVQEYAGRLLAYDQWMLREAMDLAFPTNPHPTGEAARLHLNGLGKPADELRRLRDTLLFECDRGPDGTGR
ncbi:hypothetical protein [Streptomyces sp. NPDC002516]